MRHTPNERAWQALRALNAQLDPIRGPRGCLLRGGVKRKPGAQSPQGPGEVQGVGAGSLGCPRGWAPGAPRWQCRGAGRGDSYPEAAKQEAAVGQGGCSNPLGAAGLRALGAAGIRSCWGRSRVGTARLQSPGAGRLLPASVVGAGGGLRAQGYFRALPPAGLPTGSGGGSGAARAKRRWGHVGRRAGAEAAADPAIPQPATGSHLCRDKDAGTFSKHQGSRGHKLGCEIATPSALKNNKTMFLITKENV
ncbi:uncharacterized PE-PGRS family protein PE_PGRS10-like [Herpailurus yagouaroundi]|uniref:uncharacterized PE-PGRS family protein PE_PGRS10-like n=1 Tax=Herpailurus yagouaroundi TaxID=1608482 RepID=UPI001AD63482|nr:uncharacterized PE-PGRS family protein PE_PGRS10-like [Puma yagouaroundi]